MIDAELEARITGRKWKDCPSCSPDRPNGAVRIPAEQSACQYCGGPVTNCWSCGTGRTWWYPDWYGLRGGHFTCPLCHRDPESREFPPLTRDQMAQAKAAFFSLWPLREAR